VAEGGGDAALGVFRGSSGRALIGSNPTRGVAVDSDRVKGKAKETEGEIQQKWGEAKDQARDTWEDVKDKAEDIGDEAEDRVDERDEEYAEQTRS
jgi:hypothetical protein